MYTYRRVGPSGEILQTKTFLNYSDVASDGVEGVLYEVKIKVPAKNDHLFLRKITNRTGLSLSNYSVVVSFIRY